MAKSITIRVPDELFKEMERKRYERKTSFQDVGLSHFERWASNRLNDTSQNAPTPDEKWGDADIQYPVEQLSERHRRARIAFDEVMMSGDEDTIKSLERNT